MTVSSDTSETTVGNITVLTGLPGSGKSSTLIERVNAHREAGLSTHTFACSESPWLSSRPSISRYRKLSSRRPGLTCDLDHFLTTPEAAAILRELPPGALAAFDEAQYFHPSLVQDWIDAAARGVQVLVCTPSGPQLKLLKANGIPVTKLEIICQRCNVTPAVTFVAIPGEDRTEALCEKCHAARVDDARAEIARRLIEQEPSPGEKHIYQPVDIPETQDWKVIRDDSVRRADIMFGVLEETGLLGSSHDVPVSYLDVGCNTGYFCHRMRRAGLVAEGVDVVEPDIQVARLLDAYVRRDHNRFFAEDAYKYLERTQERMFDVTSAFSVFQWVMIQQGVDKGLACLKWLFAKTNRVCFLEMGYSDEKHYQERLGIAIDRDWTKQQMLDSGRFAEVRVFEAAAHRLKRDFFVGIRPSA